MGVQYQRRERVRICDPSKQLKQDQKTKTYLSSLIEWFDNDSLLAGSSACEEDDNSAFFHTTSSEKLAEINQLYKQTLQQPATLSPDVAIAIKAQAYARDAKDCLGDENYLKI